MKPKLVIGNKNYSSWSLRPWLLMKEAGIDFEEHRIVLDTPTTKKEIAAFSEAGRVPILQLGGCHRVGFPGDRRDRGGTLAGQAALAGWTPTSVRMRARFRLKCIRASRICATVCP